jgi:hypothetical protein
MARKNSTQITLAMAFACYVGGPFETKRTRTYVSAFSPETRAEQRAQRDFFVVGLDGERKKVLVLYG